MRSTISLFALAAALTTSPAFSRTITAQDHAFQHQIRQQQPAQLFLPETTGSYKVGTVALPLTDFSRIDPFTIAISPNNTSGAYRRLMVSVFYPAALPSNESGIGSYPFASVFPPQTAVLMDGIIDAPPGTAALVTTRSYLGAPILVPSSHDHETSPHEQPEGDFPVLLFGHGFGGLRLLYTARVQELASRGWVVINIDHTYDAQVVEFSDTGDLVPAYAADSDGYGLIGGIEGLQKLRAADINFVVDQLRSNETVRAQVPGLTTPSAPTCVGGKGNKNGLKMERVGVFGHSLGGAGAAQAVSSYHKNGISCGANLDGALWGELPVDGLLGPKGGSNATAHNLSFMQMSSANVTRASRPFWGVFWETLKQQHVAVQRQFGVEGAEHNSFTDGAIYYQMLGLDVPAEEFGTIEPLRMLEVEAGYVDALFRSCLKGGDIDTLDGLHTTQYPDTFVGE